MNLSKHPYTRPEILPYEDTLVIDNDSDFEVEVSGQDWETASNEMIKQSPIFFAQEILQGRGPGEFGGDFFVGSHHLEWEDLILAHDRLCVLAPRGHGKSFTFNFIVPLWLGFTRPGEITLIFSATADQARDFLDDVRMELEDNPKLAHLVPKRKDKWNSSCLRLANGHRIFARGYGSAVRGKHPHTIIIDDGLKDEVVYSELVRSKTVTYFKTAITNMARKYTRIIVIGTPMHKNDLYGVLSKNPEYHFQKFPAITPEGKALWPEFMDLPQLARRKREIGSIEFTRELLVEPVADEMSLFPSKLFRGDPTEQYRLKLGMPKKFWEMAGVEIYVGVDFALSATIGADWFVVWTMGIDKFGNRWVIDIERHKGLGFQEQLSMIAAVGVKYDPVFMCLEANQMQQIYGMELIRTTDLPIKQFTTNAQKNSMANGVPSLRILLENKKFRIPRGDVISVEKTDKWIDEMGAFTLIDGKMQGVGEHDDLPMACWICDQAIRMGGGGMSFGDEEDYENMDQDRLLKELTGELEEDPEWVQAQKEKWEAEAATQEQILNQLIAIDDKKSLEAIEDSDDLEDLGDILGINEMWGV